MFLKITTIFKRRLHPFVLLGASLVAITLLTTLSGLWHYTYELDHQVQSAGVVVGTKKVTAAATHDAEAQLQTDVDTTESKTAALSNTAKTQQTQTNTTQAVAGGASSTPQNPVPTAVDVSLSINGTYKGKVTLAAGSNQCDVLHQALQAGVLGSLDMRYSSQYKTQAVYVIDGVGDSGTIWWTYTVNGKSPPYGCSRTKVAGGDSVNWKYVKQ